MKSDESNSTFGGWRTAATQLSPSRFSGATASAIIWTETSMLRVLAWEPSGRIARSASGDPPRARVSQARECVRVCVLCFEVLLFGLV